MSIDCQGKIVPQDHIIFCRRKNIFQTKWLFEQSRFMKAHELKNVSYNRILVCHCCMEISVTKKITKGNGSDNLSLNEKTREIVNANQLSRKYCTARSHHIL